MYTKSSAVRHWEASLRVEGLEEGFQSQSPESSTHLSFVSSVDETLVPLMVFLFLLSRFRSIAINASVHPSMRWHFCLKPCLRFFFCCPL